MVHRTGHPLAADKALAFELVSCSLPVANLRHEYTLTDTTGPAGRATGRGSDAPPVEPQHQGIPARPAAVRPAPARRHHAVDRPWPTTPTLAQPVRLAASEPVATPRPLARHGPSGTDRVGDHAWSADAAPSSATRWHGERPGSAAAHVTARSRPAARRRGAPGLGQAPAGSTATNPRTARPGPPGTRAREDDPVPDTFQIWNRVRSHRVPAGGIRVDHAADLQVWRARRDSNP